MFQAVCISRAGGAGGEEVSRAVADALGYRYVDEEVIARAAELGDVDPGDLESSEQRQSLIRRLVDRMTADTHVAEERHADDHFVYVTAETRPEALRRLIHQAIDEIASDGQVVIVAHAASHVLAGSEDVLRVWVTGSPEHRAARLAAGDLSEADAKREVGESDKGREDYLRRFLGMEKEQATDYDVVVNTDRLSADAAAHVILAAAR